MNMTVYGSHALSLAEPSVDPTEEQGPARFLDDDPRNAAALNDADGHPSEDDAESESLLEGGDLCDGAPRTHTRTEAARIHRLVVDQHAFVWRSLVRLGVPRSDAEDAVQQVFLVASRRIADILPGAERSFLYGVSLRIASRARRTQTRRREVGEDSCPERVDTAQRPDELLDRARARAVLDSILEAMPLELRSVFTLFELEQLTMSEIGDLLDLPQGTVASRLRRAREIFAEHRKRLEAKLAHRTSRSATACSSVRPKAQGGRP
jgi:RNA polymerase sigma-70 factor (ECF subfamily)